MIQAPAKSIRVAVSQSDPLLRAGLIVGTSRHADFAVVDRTEPCDVFVSDYPTAVHALSSGSVGHRHVDPGVVVVSNTARESEVREAMSLGALGFVTADCSFEELAMAVRFAQVGRRYLGERASQAMVEGIATERLTPRELEVLQWLARGSSNKVVARQLGISVGTVKTHMRGLMTKLCVKSRPQVLVTAEHRGLIEPQFHVPDVRERLVPELLHRHVRDTEMVFT